MSAHGDKRITPKDRTLAELIFNGASVAEIATTANVGQRQAIYIRAGQLRPQVRALVRAMWDDFRQCEMDRLVRAKARALDALVEATHATKTVRGGDETRESPDHEIRVKAADRLLNEIGDGLESLVAGILDKPPNDFLSPTRNGVGTPDPRFKQFHG